MNSPINQPDWRDAFWKLHRMAVANRCNIVTQGEWREGVVPNIIDISNVDTLRAEAAEAERDEIQTKSYRKGIADMHFVVQQSLQCWGMEHIDRKEIWDLLQKDVDIQLAGLLEDGPLSIPTEGE